MRELETGLQIGEIGYSPHTADAARPNTFADTNNARNYSKTLLGQEFHAVVTDLDGVVVRGGIVHPRPFRALMGATLLHPDGRVMLSAATGRTTSEVSSIVLPKVTEALQVNNAELDKGEFLVFASNGAIGIDVGGERVLYELPLDKDGLQTAADLSEMRVLQRVVQHQKALVDSTGKPVIGRAKFIEDSYTYSFGFNPEKLGLLDEHGGEGAEVAEEYREIFGHESTIFDVSDQLNVLFRANSLPFSSYTSGGLIDLNAYGASKDLAIQVTRQELATKKRRRLSQVNLESILSIGDTPLGNDAELVQRRGGFTNSNYELPGFTYPIVIEEEGDQYERAARFFESIRTIPLQPAEGEPDINADYLLPESQRQLGMPNGEVKDRFDLTGAKLITMQEAQVVLMDPSIPEAVKAFFAEHASVQTEGEEPSVLLRGKSYYETPTQGISTVYERFGEVSQLLESFDFSGGKPMSETQRTALLCVLDHGKTYTLRKLYTEFNRGITHNNIESIQAYSNVAQNLVDNYYRTLLNVDLKPMTFAMPPAPHETQLDQQEFFDTVREMDQPLAVVMQMNHITEKMKETGKRYDFVITPFYGAAELGFALRTMMDIKGFEQLPEVRPASFSGESARKGVNQSNIFAVGSDIDLMDASLLVIDDNSGTGMTLRKLKNELAVYKPIVIDAAVVQSGTRMIKVLNGEETNYGRSILLPEDIDYKATTLFNVYKSVSKAKEIAKNESLVEYLARMI